MGHFWLPSSHQNGSPMETAMLYCCKQGSRISVTYYTDIPDEIKPPVTPKLVEIKRKIDQGETLNSIANDKKYFTSWGVITVG